MHKHTLHIALFAAALLGCLSAQSQTAEAVPDRKEILIGEQVTIRLSVPFMKDSPPAAVFPAVGDTLVKNVEVVRKTEVDTLITGEDVKETRLEQKLFITSFDTGYYAVPPFTFNIDGQDFKTDAFLLTVRSVEVDTTKGIYDLRDIYEVEVGWRDYLSAYFPYIAGGIGLLALAAAVVFLVLRARKQAREKREAPPVVKKRPAHLVALESLEKTGKERNYLRGRVKQHHTEITDVLRTYIEEIFEMPAHELTSGQIMRRLRYQDLSPDQIKKLNRIFTLADMVKFAKEQPESAENDKSVEDAKDFVREVHRTFYVAPLPEDTTDQP